MDNDAKGFAARATTVESDERPRYVPTTAGLLRFFWERLDSQFDSVSDEELKWLTKASDNAQLMAGNLGKTVAGVAALVSYEMDRKGIRSGAFQPHGLPEFLYGFADVAETIEQMIAIASESDFLLRERYRGRAEGLAGQWSSESILENRAREDLAAAARAAAVRPSNRQSDNATQLEAENA